MSKFNILKIMKNTTKSEIIEIEKLVGENIKLRRLMLGITLDEMTKSLGVSLQQLGKYEKGINRVSAGNYLFFQNY